MSFTSFLYSLYSFVYYYRLSFIWFLSLRKNKFNFLLQYRFTTELPGLSKQGHKILFAKLIDTDPSHYSFEDSCKYFFMASDLIGLRNGICDGYIFIGDSTNVSFGHVGRISPMGMKKLVMYIQEGIPVRLKGIHFINTPSVMDVIINMAKPFMKKEFWNMVRDFEILHT